jgi:hypothetical protein
MDDAINKYKRASLSEKGSVDLPVPLLQLHGHAMTLMMIISTNTNVALL